MKKSIFVIITAVIALAGCSEKSKIEEAVRVNLKDPSSAKFNDLIVSDSGNFACTVWNAKNSMGGYGNWDIAELEKVGSDWYIVNLQGSSDNCTVEVFAKKEMIDRMLK